MIGALLGSWLLQYDFRLVCSAGAALFIACAAFNAWYLPAWKLSTVKRRFVKGWDACCATNALSPTY